ncbi:MAG TPA: prolyl oligopeptidase family serine peptidase, partial [Microthrixaceae bacterium]|nr:prolyl oligopeptidase family serine peptidase [Microthrixaceae bacterium]
LSWDHPAMPWDGTRLWVADLVSGDDGRPMIAGATPIAGGDDESICQPEWDHDGRLWFVSDRTDWWSLYHFDRPGRTDGREVEVGHRHAEVGLPGWVFGRPRYAFLSDGRVVFAHTSDGTDAMSVLDPLTGQVDQLDVPATTIACVAASRTTAVYVGASFTSEPSISAVLVARNGVAGGLQVIRPARDLGLSSATLSTGRAISFPTGPNDEHRAHAIYYEPANAEHMLRSGERPPLMVMVHGGPTAMAPAELRLGVQFWTSRGFAVVDVNYRGSTGFGRRYRNELRGAWGVYDIEDVEAAARFLASSGRADPERLLIRGGSAGGFTVLAALTFTDTFAAGASLYGIADLAVLARDTHKFESRYLDSLVGPWPEAAATYEERSPLHHVDRLDRPVIVLQGLDDKVVPPEQAELIVEALASRGIPHAYVAFEGEGHGFRRAENIQRALEAELSFYAQVLGMPHPLDIDPVAVRP